MSVQTVIIFCSNYSKSSTNYMQEVKHHFLHFFQDHFLNFSTKSSIKVFPFHAKYEFIIKNGFIIDNRLQSR